MTGQVHWLSFILLLVAISPVVALAVTGWLADRRSPGAAVSSIRGSVDAAIPAASIIASSQPPRAWSSSPVPEAIERLAPMVPVSCACRYSPKPHQAAARRKMSGRARRSQRSFAGKNAG